MKEEFDKELREISPLLAYLKKEQEGDSFKVPKYYFDNLADKVIAQAKETEKVGTTLKKETPQLLRASQGQTTLLARLQDFVGSLFRPQLALAFGACLLMAVAAWLMLSSKNTATRVEEATASSVPPSTNTGQSANLSTPTNITTAPVLEVEARTKGHKDAVIADNKPKTNPNDAFVAPQNATKSSETSGQNTLAEGGQLVHPQSGLTEEELALYLEENTDEYDSDGSDNNL